MRIANRPLAFLLALTLLAASVILIAEVIAHAVNANHAIVDWPSWQRWAERTHWNRAVIKVWSIILIVLGALLLALELRPSRASRIRLQPIDTATDAAVTRKGVATALTAAATDVDGVSGATTDVSTRRVSVTARSAAAGKAAAQPLTEPVTNAVETRLAELELKQAPRLSVHVTTRSR